MYIPRRETTATSADVCTDVHADFEERVQKEQDNVPAPINRKPISHSVSFVERTETANANPAPGTYSERAMQLLIASDPQLIDREALRQVVIKQRENLYGSLTLPLSIGFFLIFALAAYLHEDITNAYILESGIKNTLTEHLSDVESISGVWDWLNHTLVPRLFNQKDVRGQPLADKSQWSKVLTYNQLQGPLRLSQLRSDVEPCNATKDYGGRMLCYPQTTASRSTFGRRHLGVSVRVPTPDEYAGGVVTQEERYSYYDLAFHATGSAAYGDARRLREGPVEEYSAALPSGSDEDSFNALFFPNTNRSLIQEHLDFLFQMGWLDEQSKALRAKALLINPEVGRPRLIQFQVDIYFSRGGGVYAQTDMMTLFLALHYDMMSVAADAVFVVMLIGYTVHAIWRRGQDAIRGELVKSFLEAKFALLLQVATIAGGWICVMGYVLMALNLSSTLDKYDKVVDLQLKDTPADYPEQRTYATDTHDAVGATLNLHTWFQLIISYYHLVLMMRFFTAFRVQPRLGVVLGTLEASIVDIVHFVVVLIPTFMAYSLCGVLIFGRRLEEFSHPKLAVGHCFKMLVEGEFDWQRLSEKDWVTTAVWTWSFMLLMVVLMVNLVLAIIMDVYTEKRKQAGSSETLYQTMRALARRIWNWKHWISNHHLEMQLGKMNRLVTRDQLLRRCPGITQVQLDSLIASCDSEVQVSTGGARNSEAMRMTTAVRLSLSKVDVELRHLTEEKFPKSSQAYRAATAERGWLQALSERMAVQNHKLLFLQWQVQQLFWQWNLRCAMNGGSHKVL